MQPAVVHAKHEPVLPGLVQSLDSSWSTRRRETGEPVRIRLGKQTVVQLKQLCHQVVCRMRTVLATTTLLGKASFKEVVTKAVNVDMWRSAGLPTQCDVG